jgi:hypothetical protein
MSFTFTRIVPWLAINPRLKKKKKKKKEKKKEKK